MPDAILQWLQQDLIATVWLTSRYFCTAEIVKKKKKALVFNSPSGDRNIWSSL